MKQHRLRWRSHGQLRAVALTIVPTTLLTIGNSPSISVVRKNCPLWIPDDLPTVDQVVDSASFVAPIADLATNIPTGHVLLTVRLARNLDGPDVGVLEATIPKATADEVQSALQHAVRPREVSDPWGVRVRVVIDEAWSVSLERAPYCPPKAVPSAHPAPPGPPRPLDPESWGGPPFQRTDREEMMLELSRGIPVKLDFVVDASGRVTGAQIRGTSHSRIRDEAFLRGLVARRYQPADLDGLPVEVVLCARVRAGRSRRGRC